MSVADRAGQRIGRVRGGRAVQGQQVTYHDLDLFLAGMAGAHHGFLDLQRGVFLHRQPRVGQRAQGGAARLSQQQRGGRVLVQKDLFHGGPVRLRVSGDLTHIVQDHFQPLGQGLPRGHHDGAAGDVSQLHAVGFDDAKARAPQTRIDAQNAHQWRKCRVPVKTIAMPRSSAAAMTSASRMLPPGWITQVAPTSATTSSPSRNGKKASDATADPCRLRPAFSALMAAMRAESMRLIWPAPTPNVRFWPQNTMALDFTKRATFQAKDRSRICSRVGARRVTILKSASCATQLSGCWTSQPPPTRLTSNRLCAWPGLTSSTRTFFLAASTLSAAPVYAGAISTSRNCWLTACAVVSSTVSLKAMMPPNDEVGSVLKACWYACS